MIPLYLIVGCLNCFIEHTDVVLTVIELWKSLYSNIENLILVFGFPISTQLYDKQGDLVSFAEAYPVLAREGRGDMFWPQYLKNQKSLLYNLPQISFWATCISEIFDFGPIEDLLLHNVFLILFLCYCLHKVTFCIHF